MKKLFLIASLFYAFGCAAQKNITINDRVAARQSMFLFDWWIDRVQRDTAFMNDNSIPTSKAVRDYVAGHGGGGGAVASVYGRTGTVTALEADYQSFYPRLSQTYADPAWVSSLAWSKITGAPPFISSMPTLAQVLAAGNTSSNSISLSSGSNTANISPTIIYSSNGATATSLTPGYISLGKSGFTNHLITQTLTADIESYLPNTGNPKDTIATLFDLRSVSSSGVVVDAIPTDASGNPVSSNGVFDALTNKVDKVAGKGLSTEDYTTTEKTKLAGIAAGATANSTDATLLNRANHTGTQAATTITEDATHRFATDAEKTNWNTAYGWGNHAGLYPALARFLDSIAAVNARITGITTGDIGFALAGQLKAIDGGVNPDTIIYRVPISQIPVGAGDSTKSNDSLKFINGTGNFQIAGSAPTVMLAKGDPNNEATAQGGFSFDGSRINFTHDIYVPGVITQQYQAPEGELYPAFFNELGQLVPDFEASDFVKTPQLDDSMKVLRDSIEILKGMIAAGGGGGSVTIPYTYNLNEDLVTGWTGIRLNTAGTSSSAVAPINGDVGRARMSAASTAAPTNSAAYSLDNAIDFSQSSTITYRFKVEGYKLNALSTATTTYVMQIGFQDKFTTTTSEPADDAVCFRYTHGENSGKLQAYVRAGTGTASVTDLGVTVDTNPHDYEVTVLNGVAKFYVDGSLVGTVSTGLPGSGQNVGGGIHTWKTVDTGTNTVTADLSAIRMGWKVE